MAEINIYCDESNHLESDGMPHQKRKHLRDYQEYQKNKPAP